MPIEIRELIIRARVEPDGDRPAQPAVQPTGASGGSGLDEDRLAQVLRDMKER